MTISDIKISDIQVSKEEQQCAPHLSFENGSCIPLEILVELAEAYNKNNNNNHIKLDKSALITIPNKYKKYLVSQLKKRIKGNQTEWIKQNFTKNMDPEKKEQLKEHTFRPDGPQGQFEWLSTLDINYTIQQYQNKYDDFVFLGAVPIDFNDLDYYPFKKINFNDFLKNNKSRLGVVFNLDRHDQGGSHWVSLFIDLKKAQIYFSDSVGYPPGKEILDFMNRVKKFLQSRKMNVDMRVNETQHQKGNSECGVYSINWILRLLKGKSFDHLTKKRLDDKKINTCRIKYFKNAHHSNNK